MIVDSTPTETPRLPFIKPSDRVAVTHQGNGSAVSIPPVTVIIPTHNRPQLMRRALSSVLAQTYEGDIEVIVVFDACEPELPRSHYHPIGLSDRCPTPGLVDSPGRGTQESLRPPTIGWPSWTTTTTGFPTNLPYKSKGHGSARRLFSSALP